MARGRSAGRPTVEGCLTLNMTTLRKQGMLVCGRRTGWVSWSYPAIGTLIPERLIGAVSYEVETTGMEGRVRLTQVMRVDPFGNPIEQSQQTIRLEATVPPFGGLRWWFVCPLSGRLVSKLHLPQGRERFGSQAAYRLGYASQREDAHARACRRARRVRSKIGGSVNLSDRLPHKPKWMRWRTYERHRAACDDAGQRAVMQIAASAQRIMGRGIEGA